MFAPLARHLIMIAETIGIRAVIERLARLLFTPPSPYPLPSLPGAARLIPGVERIFTQTCLDYFEKAFWAGVIQGTTFGFAAGIVCLLLIVHNKNVAGYLKNVAS